MRVIQWQDSYKIGHDAIDKQHRKLVSMIASLQQAVNSDNADEATSQTLKELVDYTQYHFRDEEKLMREIGYSDIEHHKYLHRQMLEQVIQILTDIKSGKPFDAPDLVNYLTHWLTDHIVVEDGKIGQALKAKKRQMARA